MGWAPGVASAVEGGDDMLYAVASGDLLGTKFKYSMFGKSGAADTPGYPRALLLQNTVSIKAGGFRAGSPAALRLV